MNYAVWLWRHTRGIRLNMAVRIVIGLIQVGLGLLMVWLCKRFIDVTIRTGTDADVWLMVGALMATVVGGVIMRQVYYVMGVKAHTRQTNDLRLSLFDLLFTTPLFAGHDRHSGDIASRLSKDIDVVGDATTSMIPQLLVTSCRLLGAFMFMYVMDHRLAWLLLVLTPVTVGLSKLLSYWLRTMTRDIREAETRIQTLVQEGMEHNALLRTLGSEQLVGGWLSERQEILRRFVMRRAYFTTFVRFLLGLTFGLGYLVAFVWGALQLREGVITFGVMTSFLQLVGQIQQPVLTLSSIVPQFLHTMVSIDRLQELQDEAETNTALPTCEATQLLPTGSLGLRLADVSYCYAGQKMPVFSHFSFDFRPGSKTALMGTTGAGKTTLLRLLLALVEPQEGRIEVYDAERCCPVSMTTRRLFVFVPQGNTVLSGTVRHNLLLARPGATDDELRQALHVAMADFVFDLPAGLDTELGEHGMGLSEGQAQRIAIARGLLRPGSILLLDEVSSALDPATEQALFSRLFVACPGKTMLIVTHRPSVARLCDATLHLDGNLSKE